jgi:hypothetical protein
MSNLRKRLEAVQGDFVATAKLLDRVKIDSEECDYQVLVKHCLDSIEERTLHQIKAFDGAADSRLQLYAGYLQCLEIVKHSLFVLAKDDGVYDDDEETNDGNE